MSLTKLLAVGRLARNDAGEFVADKHRIIAYVSSSDADSYLKSYKAHIKEIMAKGAHKLKPGKRVRLTNDTSGDGDYDLHVVSDHVSGREDNTVVFFAVTDTKFSENNAVGNLLKDFKAAFYRENDEYAIAGAKSNGSVHKNSQASLRQVLDKYRSSKLADVQNKVDAVKQVMKTNVQQALDNTEKLDEMELKSEKFEDHAKKFKKGATDVKKKMRCKYYKVTAAMFFMIAVVIGIIALAVVYG